MTYERYLQACMHLDEEPLTEAEYREMQQENYD